MGRSRSRSRSRSRDDKLAIPDRSPRRAEISPPRDILPPPPPQTARPTIGDMVTVIAGVYRGKSGIIIEDDGSRRPYKIEGMDVWLYTTDIVPGGRLPEDVPGPATQHQPARVRSKSRGGREFCFDFSARRCMRGINCRFSHAIRDGRDGGYTRDGRSRSQRRRSGPRAITNGGRGPLLAICDGRARSRSRRRSRKRRGSTRRRSRSRRGRRGRGRRASKGKKSLSLRAAKGRRKRRSRSRKGKSGGGRRREQSPSEHTYEYAYEYEDADDYYEASPEPNLKKGRDRRGGRR